MIPTRYIAATVLAASLLVASLACQSRREPRERPVRPDTTAAWDASDVLTRGAGRWDWSQATDVPADMIDRDLVEQLRQREERVHGNPGRLSRVVRYGDDRNSHYYVFESDVRTDTLTGYRVEPASRRVLERIERIPT